MTKEELLCDLCSGGTGRCASCQQEIDDQLARMGHRPAEDCPLTARELECLALFGEGLTYKEVGLKLRIETSTVRTHVTGINQKLGTPGSAQAWIFCVRRGWIIVEGLHVDPSVTPSAPVRRCAVCDAEVSGGDSYCRACARERDEQLVRMEPDEFEITHAMRGYLFAFDQFLRGEGSRAAMAARLVEMYREKGLEPPVAVKRRVEVLRFMSQNGPLG